jgi:hypothetical protein
MTVRTDMKRTTYQMKRNPRKISVEAADALLGGHEYKNSNTEVKKLTYGLYTLVLHGTEIAWYDIHSEDLMVHDGFYPGTVTKERLNALPNVQVHHSKKQLYLNGKEWNGRTAVVVSGGTPVFPYQEADE